MMEVKEIFRVQNAQLDVSGESSCTLTLNLMEGELLGVHIPRMRQGLSLISKVLMRKIPIKSGGLFYYETEYGSEPPARGWPIISCIQSQGSLVEEMSIMDNLFLLRRRRNRGGLYSNRRLQIEAARQMESFGLPFLPGQSVSTLSRMEKCVLEVFKAYLHGADIIILDQISWETAAVNVVRLLLDLIAHLKDKGISFIIISDKLNNLKACANRIAFFDGTQIVSILDNTPEYGDLISDTYDTLVRGLVQRDDRNARLLEQGESIEFKDPFIASLDLVRGEKVVIFDPTAKLYHYLTHKSRTRRIPLTGGFVITQKSKWRKWEEKPRLIFADFSKYDTVFESLPVMDNLLIGRNNGFSAFRIIRKKYRNMLKSEFVERFADSEMLEYKESNKLTLEQRFKLYLFKVSLLNPDVLIVWRCPKADPVMVELMGSTADKLVSDNKTICYLSMDVFEHTEKADRYLLVTNTGVECYSTYRELMERQMRQRYEERQN